MGLALLHRASLKGQNRGRVVRVLCRAGADLEATFEGLRPSHMASGRGNDEVLLVLLEQGADKDARTIEGFTALHCAAGKGGISCVRILLQAGADANVTSTGPEKQTPLHAAAVLGDASIVEELLKHGANADVGDSEGNTALHITAAIDHVEVARSLLQASTSIEATRYGSMETPLHVASSEGSCGVLEALLEAGANVLARNSNGDTPLHCACRSLEYRAVNLLLHWDADESIVNKQGKFPAEVMGHDIRQSIWANSASVTSERISFQLAKAPADRRWRHRGWMVCLRARHQFLDALEAASSLPTSWALMNPTNEREHGREKPTVCLNTSRASSDTGVCTSHLWHSYVTWTIQLQEEGIFRYVLSFV